MATCLNSCYDTWTMQRWFIQIILLGLIGMGGCGSKDPDTISVQFSFTAGNVFQDPDLADIVFFITDADAPTARFAFPSACSPVPTPPGCGFPNTTTEFRLDPTVDKDRRITISVQGRNSAGTKLFEGVSAPFLNNPSTSPITIAVSPSS